MNPKKKTRKDEPNRLTMNCISIRIDSEELKRAKEKISELTSKVQSLEVSRSMMQPVERDVFSYLDEIFRSTTNGIETKSRFREEDRRNPQ